MSETRLASVTADRRLVTHAAIMTLLGLLAGFTPLFAKAPRAALSAHTIGVLQGALLFALAAVWPSLGTGRVVTAARYCALIGLYANWLGAQLSALWSAKGMFIVNGASMPGGAAPWMEGVVAVLLNLSALVIVMCVLVLWVVRKQPARTGEGTLVLHTTLPATPRFWSESKKQPGPIAHRSAGILPANVGLKRWPPRRRRYEEKSRAGGVVAA